jgi:hypothetical protein
MKGYIRLVNGASYTEKQIKTMFDSQIRSVKRQVVLEDRKMLNSWLSNSNSPNSY